MSCHIRLEEKVIIVIPFEPDSFKFSNEICKAKPIKVHTRLGVDKVKPKGWFKFF